MNPSLQQLHRPQSGFTLVEIIITIAIMSIAIGLAAPPLQEFIRSNRLTSTANKLVSAIIYARNESISRRENVVIAPAGNGWRVTVDPAVGADVELARYELDNGLRIEIDGDLSVEDGVTFTPDGYRDLTAATPPANFTFTVCDPNTDFNRIVTVTAAGTTRVTTTQGGCPG